MVAGVSAALSASRLNKKVILCEREFALGGLATLGLIAIYLPLCDGMGRQVSFGIAEELLKLSVSLKPYKTRGYSEWIENRHAKKDSASPRYEVDFNPSLFAIAMEKLLIKNGAKILYGTVAVNAYQDGDYVSAVVFENKSGRFAIKPKGVVDATGDCDLAKFLSLPCALRKSQNPLASWYYFHSNGKVNLNLLGACDLSEEEQAKGATVERLSSRRFSGIDGEELSEMTKLSHQSVLNDFNKKLKKDKDCDLTSIATIPLIRMTRRLVGEYDLDEKDAYKRFNDSVGLISDWRKRGPIFEVPLRALYNGKVKNYAVAGRCISVTDAMWDITRVIPCCAVTGEAVGTALALCSDLTKIDVSALQSLLKGNGVRLTEKDL